MKLRVKNVDIHTGGPLIAILHSQDAEGLDIHYGDRILLRHNLHSAIAVADITHNHNTVMKGRIGLMEELERKLNAKNMNEISVSVLPPPESPKIIRKKMGGAKLNYHEFRQIISETVKNSITESELSAFVTSCFINDLTNQEVVYLCRAMVDTGERLSFRNKTVMDVHCIGGVPGNRTTIVIVPIIAAAGLLIPKTSSRAITSPSGTADTVETFADVTLDIKKLKSIVKKTKGVLAWGGALNLAPADDKIIRIEHPLNIDAEGQMIASVMAKKFAVGSTHVLLDIPIGGNAKVRNLEEAKKLKKRFEFVGSKLGIKMKIIFSEGKEPIGNGIGPALEALDTIKVLKNTSDAPLDLKDKSIFMAGIMLEMGGKAKKGQGFALAERLLVSGKAFKKFNEIIAAQGKVPKSRLKPGKFQKTFFAHNSGKIKFLDASLVSRSAKMAGAPKDFGAGIYLFRHLKDKVSKGDKLLTVYSNNSQKLKNACAQIDAVYRIV